MALLEVRDLKSYFFTRYGVVKAVDGVSFDIDEGETLGLVGESACGKSVTGLSILRLLQKPAGKIVGGQILYNGEDLLLKSEEAMRSYRGRHLSMILQDPMLSLNPVFTIGYQIGEGITVHQGRRGQKPLREKVLDVMRQMRIPAAETRISDYPHQFSGGMRQRVGGAIALVCEPHLLIADEPTTSLDVTTQMVYLNLLREVQKERGLAIIFITHDFGIVAKMCDRVAVMYAGRIVEMAGVNVIFDNPAHPYTRALMQSVPRLEKKVERLFGIAGQPPNPIDLPVRCTFSPRCSERIERCQHEAFPPQIDLACGHIVRCWRYV